MNKPSLWNVRLAICDAIVENDQKVLDAYKAGEITYEQCKAQMFPIGAAAMVRYAIAKEWDKCL